VALSLVVQRLEELEEQPFKMAKLKTSNFVDIEQELIATKQVLKAGTESGIIAGTAVECSSADCIA
jgi:predicted nicotinamide N-methyase